MKSGGFLTDFMKSGGFQVKYGGFRTDFTSEIRRISKDQLPGMVSPMFSKLNVLTLILIKYAPSFDYTFC